MKLRGKLLLAQAPMIAALALIAGTALYAALRFGDAPGAILYDNFRSFDAARSMLHTVNEIDRLVLSATIHERPLDKDALAESIGWFERELVLQESNITEQGEAEATARLRQAWSQYRDQLADVGSSAGLEQHQQRAHALRSAIDAILQLNRDAMRTKSMSARRAAERVGAALAAMAVVGFILAVVISGIWLRRLLAPMRVLEQAVHRLSEGDFEARIRLPGNDEVGSLARSFNQMAEKLAQYRASSLGELLEANNRLSSVMDSLADAVVVYDRDGRSSAYNEVAQRLLGEDCLDIDRLPESLQDVVRDAFERVCQSGEPHEPTSLEAAVEVSAVPAPRWILVSATPVRDRGGVLAGVTVAFRDVTRARRIEGFKGDLVAAAAHELRTPLTSLHLAVHLCLEGAAGPLTERQQDLLAAARQDCERLQSVVEELLEMARLESGSARLSWAVLDVGELVRDAVARHEARARQAGMSVTAVPGDTLLAVEADPDRMRHVLDNLIDNALKHAGRGGIQISFEAAGDWVRLFVDDAGPGVPEELRERVFAKFFRVPGTTKQGTGLGLSIVQDIVHAHGGRVGVEASPLGGARFWLTLPAAHSAGGQTAQEDASGSSLPSS